MDKYLQIVMDQWDFLTENEKINIVVSVFQAKSRCAGDLLREQVLNRCKVIDDTGPAARRPERRRKRRQDR